VECHRLCHGRALERCLSRCEFSADRLLGLEQRLQPFLSDRAYRRALNGEQWPNETLVTTHVVVSVTNHVVTTNAVLRTISEVSMPSNSNLPDLSLSGLRLAL
jgi:hypothetical protein